MQNIISTFADIFQEPSGLPPHRDVAHYISLKKGIKPINIWPYCYAHFQKKDQNISARYAQFRPY